MKHFSIAVFKKPLLCRLHMKYSQLCEEMVCVWSGSKAQHTACNKKKYRSFAYALDDKLQRAMKRKTLPFQEPKFWSRSGFLSAIFLIALSLFPLWLKALSFETTPVVNVVETNHVSIEWMANEPASATLYYGHNVNFLNTKIDSPSSQFHRVTLHNLSPNTQYYFKITLKNAGGLAINTPFHSFKTKLQLPSLHPLFTKQPQFNTHNEMAKLFWETNVPTLGTIHYGTDTNLKQSREVLILNEKQEIDLEDLKPQTKYYFEVEIQNASGAKKMSQRISGITPSLLKKPVTIELELSPTISQITSKSALLEIILNEEAPLTIHYGKSKNLEKKIESPQNLKEHKIKFENLEPNQIYYYKIKSQEKNISPVYEFRTNFY